jgi:hypothetical protein
MVKAGCYYAHATLRQVGNFNDLGARVVCASKQNGRSAAKPWTPAATMRQTLPKPGE